MPPTPTLTHNSALSSPISGSSPVEINKIDPRDGQQNGKEKEDCGESNERNWAIKKLNQKLLPNSCGRVEAFLPCSHRLWLCWVCQITHRKSKRSCKAVVLTSKVPCKLKLIFSRSLHSCILLFSK